MALRGDASLAQRVGVLRVAAVEDLGGHQDATDAVPSFEGAFQADIRACSEVVVHPLTVAAQWPTVAFRLVLLLGVCDALGALAEVR